MSLTQIATAVDTEGLAEHLQSPDRSRVVVVISCPSGSPEPRFDAEEIDKACDGHADVFVIPTGSLSYQLTDHLPPDTSVYGGAARVYPRGESWKTEPYDAPLVFAFTAEEAKRKTDDLVERAWTFHYRPAEPARTAVARRAPEAAAVSAGPPLRTNRLPGPHLVASKPVAGPKQDSHVAPELAETAENPIPAPVRAAQPVPVPRPPIARTADAERLAAALAEAADLREEIQSVRDDAAEYEQITNGLLHQASETVDGYRKLLVAARTKTSSATELEEAKAFVAELQRRLAAAEDELTRRKAVPKNPAPASDAAAESERLREELRVARVETQANKDALLTHRQQTSELVDGYRGQLAALRGKKAPAATPTAVLWEPELFDEDESPVRHSVYLAWTRRVPAPEKAQRPLPDYDVGAGFAASIDALDTGQRAKAFKCAVDILTDLARDMPSRRVHPLRLGTGPEDSAWTRADGAVCFRANIETNAASARRLHYWKLPDGRLELGRVVVHDDMTP